MERDPVVIIGAGPAGLTAAYELSKLGRESIVLEKENLLGGLARTESYKGFYFDIGGHRFFTKVKEIKNLWHEVLGDHFLRRPRLSRIFYNGKFFNYPLKPLNALRGLGVLQGTLILLSYLRWHVFPYPREETFEQWVTNRFGKRLFSTFFKTYTEKVWGIPCSELKAEWAAQRIKDLSLKTALLSMFLKPKTTIKTLIEEFDYPERGPGMMWNTVGKRVVEFGSTVRLNAEVTRIARNGARIEQVVVSSNGEEEVVSGSVFISSMPVTEFIKKLEPPPPSDVLAAAKSLKYRDFLTVCLIVNRAHLFPDNWIYVHDPEVKVGRIQNFKNWSPDMVPDPAKTSLGLEYFCTEGDALWSTADAELIELGKGEVERIGLASRSEIEDGCVVRVSKAYPIYDADYRDHLAKIRDFVEQLENLQTIGRNGLHRYNNQDHAMLTGILAVKNLVLDEKNDLWSVNTDPEYHEEMMGEEELETTEQLLRGFRGLLPQVFPKLDRVALGVAMGCVAGVLIFAATLFFVIKGGVVVGPNLALLGQIFPGYRVSVWGSLIGLAYGWVVGFLGGFLLAFLRNLFVLLYVALIYRRTEYRLMRRLFEYL